MIQVKIYTIPLFGEDIISFSNNVSGSKNCPYCAKSAPRKARITL